MHDAPSSRVRWVVLGLIVLASFISYALRTNMSFVGNTMIADLGMNEVQLGMVLSAFAAGYAIFQFPGGVFGGRFGARFAVAAIAIAWGVLTIATGLMPGTDVASLPVVLACLIGVRFLVGVTHAPIFPVIGGAIGNWFPVGKWGLPNGLSSSGLNLGAAAAAPIVVWLAEAYGWRASFFLTAPIGFGLAALWWWYMRDYPKDHPRVSARELALIDADRSPPRARVGKNSSWRAVLVNRDILLITLSYFCMNYVFYLFFNWFYFYLVDVKGFGIQEATVFTSAQWIIGTLGATLGGFSCDQLIARFGLRRGPQLFSIASLVLTALFLALGATAGNPYLAVALLALSFGCTQLTEAAYWATMIAIAGRDASEAGGVINTGANLAGVVGGVLVPLSAELFGWTAAVSMGSVFALIAALLWVFIRGDRPMLAERNAARL